MQLHPKCYLYLDSSYASVIVNCILVVDSSFTITRVECTNASSVVSQLRKRRCNNKSRPVPSLVLSRTELCKRNVQLSVQYFFHFDRNDSNTVLRGSCALSSLLILSSVIVHVRYTISILDIVSFSDSTSRMQLSVASCSFVVFSPSTITQVHIIRDCIFNLSFSSQIRYAVALLSLHNLSPECKMKFADAALLFFFFFFFSSRRLT